LTAEFLTSASHHFVQLITTYLHRDTVDAEEEDDLFVLFQQIATAVNFILQPFLKRKESILSWQKKVELTRGGVLLSNGEKNRTRGGVLYI
jgi:hypothetical protein